MPLDSLSSEQTSHLHGIVYLFPDSTPQIQTWLWACIYLHEYEYVEQYYESAPAKRSIAKILGLKPYMKLSTFNNFTLIIIHF